MELHDREIENARAYLAETGRSKDDYAFALSFLPPDPDGGGMFTVRYEVTAKAKASGKAETFIGGIGLNWVEQFKRAVEAEAFA